MAEQPEIILEVTGDKAVVAMFKVAPERIKAKLAEIVSEYAFLIQREAMILAPVDTGFLRSSIVVMDAGEPTEKDVVAATDYAHFVEFGTKRTPAQPFMMPAAMKYREDFKEAVAGVLRNPLNYRRR